MHNARVCASRFRLLTQLHRIRRRLRETVATHTRFDRIARSNMPNTLQYVRVTGTNMETRCLRRVRACSMDQLRAYSISHLRR